MNFFEAQRQARTNTIKIILLFVLAVAAIDISLYLLAHLSLSEIPLSLDTIDYSLLIDISVALLALISIGSIYKIIALSSGGGAAVAASMGGRLINSSAANNKERQLLNIVEEMAIASGIAPPPIYLIPDPSINAFAAGNKISTAVIGVTQGSVDSFSRDEMQGVIAHEFSHIINGDMNLNMRLTGVIHGIMLMSYLGYFMLRAGFFSSVGSRRDGAAMAIPMIGLVLIVVGFIGAFFGKCIRATVSRQREFLADASAVQFTRNPLGIGAALQKIGVKTGLLSSPHADQYAHMFFAAGLKQGLLSMMSTHPPIDERIARVMPKWDGQSVLFDKTTTTPAPDSAGRKQAAPSAATANASAFNSATREGVAGLQQSPTATPAGKQPPDLFGMLFNRQQKVQDISTKVGNIDLASLDAAKIVVNMLPDILEQALHDSYSARALVYATLLDRQADSEYRESQLQHVDKFADTGVYQTMLKLIPEVEKLPQPVCPMIILRAIPALRSMSKKQYKHFLDIISTLIKIDKKFSLFEWAEKAVLMYYLDSHFNPKKKIAMPASKAAMEYTLSTLARIGQKDPKQAQEAFTKASKIIAPNLKFITEDSQPNQLYASLHKLGNLSFQKKKKILEAACACATHDDYINANENTLLHAYSALLDCPLPIVIE